MIVYFARHGESLANTSRVISNRSLPHPLTENGRLQALQLAERLKLAGITAIYTSPVPRALETAQIIGRVLQIPPQKEEGLREFDAGVLEGRSGALTWVRFSALWNNWFYRRQFHKRISGGESFSETAARFYGFTTTLASFYGETDAHVLCISHGGLLRVGLSGLLENLDFEQVRDRQLHYTTVITTGYTDGKWRCLDWDGAIPAEGG
jgi:probable phosphoglycerate mutase